MNTTVYFSTWSKKLGISIDEIQKSFDNFVNEEKNIHKELDSNMQEKRALQRLALQYKKQLKSPAIGFEGMIIGIGDLFDTAKKMREIGMDAFRENPHQAITQGLTDNDGNPLDTREFFGNGKSNFRYNKPLPEHSYMRTVIGIGLKSNTNDLPKVFTLTLNGDNAENLNVEMFKPCRFRAIDKSSDDVKLLLNGSSITRFEVDETTKMPSPFTLLKDKCDFIPMNKLEEYHQANKDDFNRLALVEGDVSLVMTQETSIGNKMMVIEDMNNSMDDLDASGVTCWVPKHINFDFAEGSKVIVIGRTAQGKSREDPNVLGDVMINVLGIYVIPEFKIEPEKTFENVIESNVKLESEEIENIKSQATTETSDKEEIHEVNNSW
jgi:hypothetical protein